MLKRSVLNLEKSFTISNTQPLISVIVSTYNRRNLVLQAVDGVLAQSLKSFELIIIDDGSTDGTNDVLKARYDDKLVYVWQENQGESAARNHGASLASGKYLAFLDSDDVWEPEKLEWQVRVLDGNPKAVLAFSSYWFIDSQGKRIVTRPNGMITDTREINIPNLLLLNVRMGGSNPMITKTAFEMVGGFDTSIQYGEDVDFILRLKLLGDFVYVNRPLLNIRHHEGNQGALARPGDVRRYLQEHLQVVDRTVSTMNSPQESLTLKQRAYAFYCQRAAFQCFSWWMWEQGLEYLAMAAEYEPDFVNEPRRMSQSLIHYGKLGRNTEDPCEVAHFLHYLQEIKKHWSKTLPVNENAFLIAQSSLVVYACQELFRRKNKHGVRQACKTAIRLDKRNLLNPGIIRRLFWSFIP